MVCKSVSHFAHAFTWVGKLPSRIAIHMLCVRLTYNKMLQQSPARNDTNLVKRSLFQISLILPRQNPAWCSCWLCHSGTLDCTIQTGSGRGRNGCRSGYGSLPQALLEMMNRRHFNVRWCIDARSRKGMHVLTVALSLWNLRGVSKALLSTSVNFQSDAAI